MVTGWGLVPDSGHLVHMATHIDVFCGNYRNMVARNTWVAYIDRKFFGVEGGENFYTVYRYPQSAFHRLRHDVSGSTHAPAGRCPALKDTLPEPVVRFLPEIFEAFTAMTPHILVRFGM